MPKHSSSFKANLIAPSDAQSSMLSYATTDNPTAYEDAPQIRAAEQVRDRLDRMKITIVNLDLNY